MIFMGAGLHAAQPLKIGVILARTGNAALDSKNGFEAAEYAAQIINAKGGILHRPVELVELDNGSTALGSRKAALEAVKKGYAGLWAQYGAPIPLQWQGCCRNMESR